MCPAMAAVGKVGPAAQSARDWRGGWS